MGFRSKGRICSRRMREQIELYKVERGKDEFGKWIEVNVCLECVAADVIETGGERFEYYRGLGYSHPLTITIWKPDYRFDKVKYKGKWITVINMIEHRENRDLIVMTADYDHKKKY